MSTSSWFYHNHKAKFTSDMQERNFKPDMGCDYQSWGNSTKKVIPPDKGDSTRHWSPLFFKFPFPRKLFVGSYTKTATSTQLKGCWIHIFLCKASFENYFKGVYCSFEAALYIFRQIKNLPFQKARKKRLPGMHSRWSSFQAGTSSSVPPELLAQKHVNLIIYKEPRNYKNYQNQIQTRIKNQFKK